MFEMSSFPLNFVTSLDPWELGDLEGLVYIPLADDIISEILEQDSTVGRAFLMTVREYSEFPWIKCEFFSIKVLSFSWGICDGVDITCLGLLCLF